MMGMRTAINTRAQELQKSLNNRKPYFDDIEDFSVDDIFGEELRQKIDTFVLNTAATDVLTPLYIAYANPSMTGIAETAVSLPKVAYALQRPPLWTELDDDRKRYFIQKIDAKRAEEGKPKFTKI